jgi:hypothetical protein
MATLVVTPDTTKAEIAEAITHLRADQRAAIHPDDHVALSGQIDELLARWREAPA